MFLVNVKIIFWLVFSFLFLLLAYSPFLVFPFTIIGLFLFGISNYQREYNKYVVLFLIFSCFSLLINVMSIPNFLNMSDDFTTYYNNYLSLYSGDLTALFQFSGGLEIGLPLINLFLSAIINGQYPFVLRFFHCFILLCLYLYLIKLIIKRLNLNWKDISLLLALMLCFFKLSLSFYFLRQGYSSLFILMGFFAINRSNRVLFFFLSALFHLSSIVIIPLIYFLLEVKGKKSHVLFRFSCVFISILILLFLSKISLISFDNVFLQKLNFFFYYLNNQSYVLNSIKSTLTALIYLIPLLALSFISKDYKHSNETRTIVSIIFFSISFSYLPSITTRLMMPIFTFLMGYFYFISFRFVKNIYIKIIIVLLTVSYLNINWIFKDVLYYYRYPMVSTTPFYYLSLDFLSIPNIDRSSLDSEVKIINENKI
ncbi:EpsG family protein [Photobacterium leiognathi]|uniref:EpsG family protein n=1 Tax=Photobacterium leiognathi TaxID=553611 RepID=UPI0029829690|nr:EpsG family protein [Photobacterium leiognathi]